MDDETLRNMKRSSCCDQNALDAICGELDRARESEKRLAQILMRIAFGPEGGEGDINDIQSAQKALDEIAAALSAAGVKTDG